MSDREFVLTSCSCLVVTGGYHALNPSCPIHGKSPVAPPLTAGPALIDQHREHLAFVAVMNALDVHMPPDGATLLTELRAIAATVGYPWRGNGGGGAVKPPLAAGPVAPPPDWREVFRRAHAETVDVFRDIEGMHSPREAAKQAADYMLEVLLGEAPRGAARPPEPPESLPYMRIYIDREDDGRFCASWERYFRDDGKPAEGGAGPYAATVVGALAELCATLLKVDEDDAIEAQKSRKAEAARPPASPPALVEASVRELVENYTKSGGCGWCGGLPHSSGCLVGRMERALAVPPEAPPP